MQANPVLVEATRGGVVESAHRGAVAVVDADGGLLFSLGAIDRPVFPRSAVKPLQALVLMESGAADRFDLDDAAIALACASHRGEPFHTECAARSLAKAGLAATALECGAHWPMSESAGRDLASRGETPTALHNNCSGKHAGFLLAATALGVERKGYIEREHEIMRAMAAALAELSGAPLGDAAACGVDGCSIPTFAISLRALALSFARFGSGAGLSPGRAAMAKRIRRAVATAPLMISGTDRFDSEVAAAYGDAVLVKTGAEGVYCGAFAEAGLGVAIKCDDGAARAAETMMAALIRRFADSAENSVAARYADRPLRNWNGIEVGRLQAAETLLA